MEGDAVLSSAALTVVVGGMRRRPELRGAVVSVTRRGHAEEAIALVAPRVWVAGGRFPIVIRTVSLVERPAPTVRVTGVAQVGTRELRVTRELHLVEGQDALASRTRVTLVRGEALDEVAFGERVAWGGGSPFSAEGERVPFIGREGDFGAVAFGFEDSFEVAREYEQHGDERFLLHTELRDRSAPLAVGGSLRSGSWLTVADGLATATRQLGWARGERFEEVTAMLPRTPPGARATAFVGGEVVSFGKPDHEGRVILPVPRDASEIIMVATAHGHAPSEAAIVTAGARARLEIPPGGQLLVKIRDEAGALVPGRIRVLGIEGSAAPDFGPEHRAAGAKQTVITVTGEIEVAIPTGRYRVLVSRGPEFDLRKEEVEVTATRSATIDVSLAHVIDPRRWVPSDLHVHAAPSPDSEVSLDDRVASLVAEGIRFAVPTEHNQVGDYGPAIAARSVTLSSVTGVEVTTWDPAFGHFNVFPFPRIAERPRGGAPEFAQRDPATLFAELRESEDAVIQVNHPRLEPDIGYFDTYGYDVATGAYEQGFSEDFDVVEIWNGFDLARPQAAERSFQDWLAILARGRRVTASGNSDSHYVRYQWAGYPRTYVWSESGPNDPRGIIESLKAGRVFVSNGLFLEAAVNGRGPGELVEVEAGEITLRVLVRAPRWIDARAIEVWVGGELRETRLIDPLPEAERPVVRFDETLPIAIERDSFVIVRARGEEEMTAFFGRANIRPGAFTNPIFVDADGDGRTPWKSRPAARDASLDASDASLDANGSLDANDANAR